MPISSLAIRTETGCEKGTAEAIGALGGVTVETVEPGALIAVIETGSKREDLEIWDRVRALPCVLSVGLVYHNVEDILEDES